LNREPDKPIEPKIKEFIRYVLSYEGQLALMNDGKYLPLMPEVLQEQLKNLE
jgi:phosphate transport system substrate-binding protein